MRLLAATIAVALAASAGVAVAAQERVSDSRYVQMARCAGLAEGSGAEAEALDAALRANRRGRSDHVRERAINARNEAAAAIRAASGEDLAQLTSERDQTCRTLAG